MILCKAISKNFGDRAALADVGFTVKPGRICALAGPNGAGKSTLIGILSGQLAPSSGSVSICGIDSHAGGPDLRRILGVVPEGLALFDDLTIEEHLLMSGPIYGLSRAATRERAGALLRALELEPVERTPARLCSNGTRKKTALALALLHNPPVVLLDEPFEGLDPLVAETVRTLLSRMAQRGATVLLTSHILPLVSAVADDLVLLAEGRVKWNSEVGSLPHSVEELFFRIIEAPPPEDLPWLGRSLS